jgi:hypothetical protein
MAVTLRYLRMAQLRTLGPSNKIRGWFLIEPTDGERERVWNARKKCWLKGTVNLWNQTQVADHRAATPADLAKVGFKLPAGHYLAGL